MDEGSDEALWVRSLQGDGGAFGHLFDRHYARVYRHAGRLLPVRADAEDVTAAAFLELWRCRERVRVVNRSVLPWLLVTTANLARNVRRGTRRHRELLQRLPREDDAPDAADLAQTGNLLDGEDDDLNAALRTLRRPDLQLITLVVIEGFSLPEAAAVLGISATAAKTRLHRARARLRASLPDHPAALPHLTGSGDRP